MGETEEKSKCKLRAMTCDILIQLMINQLTSQYFEAPVLSTLYR